MFEAVGTGLVQGMIGKSAVEFQRRIDESEQVVVGVNKYLEDDDAGVVSLPRPAESVMQGQLDRLRTFKAARSKVAVDRALDRLAFASINEQENIFEHIVSGVESGLTNGEICGKLRDEMGFGNPLVAA
tara:strand:- start:1178 stop:1564 length:387 start_codon:yes stop_codon:yes gene_type:complete